MQIDIPDNDLDGFNNQAQLAFTLAVQQFAQALIEEANRLEAHANASNGPPEITSSNVNDANLYVRKGWAKKRKTAGSKFRKALSSILPFLVDMMYNSDSLQDRTYLLLFILALAFTIILVSVSNVKDD